MCTTLSFLALLIAEKKFLHRLSAVIQMYEEDKVIRRLSLKNIKRDEIKADCGDFFTP